MKILGLVLTVLMAGLLTAPAASNVYAGLRFTVQGGAEAGIGTNGALLVSNLGTQAEGGVSFELGQAQGFLALQEATQMESRRFLTRTFGRQGGRFLPLVSMSCKWNGPEFDASKNEVAIETLELAHEGLWVRHYDARGLELAVAGPFQGGGTRLTYESPTGAQAVRSGTITVLDQDLSSVVGRHSLRFIILPPWIVSPRDSASGLPTGKVMMGGGPEVEGVAFSALSYEGLAQPVEALERIDLLAVDGTTSFAVVDAGLFQRGVWIRGDRGTLLGGFNDVRRPGFYGMPEVDDEVLVTFCRSDIGDLGGLLEPFHELGLPLLDWNSPGAELVAQNTKGVRSPEAPGVIESVGTKYTLLRTAAGFSVNAAFEIPRWRPNRVGHLQILNQGAEVAAFLLDGKGGEVAVEELELAGVGRPIGARPGPGPAGNRVETGIRFDAPMTITVGGNTYLGDELSFGAEIEFPETMAEAVETARLSLRSPGDGGYRFVPEEPWDWGDLPAPYMTTASQGGARHRIVRGLCLGRRIDPESNGRPDLHAVGDDQCFEDDEDGVNFTSALVVGIKGSIVNINVVAPPAGAHVDAFLDWDGNGDFEGPGEKFLDRRRVISGLNTFTFDVPADARPGPAFARFRLSLDGGLDCGGPAGSGEVEDCIVRILSEALPPHASGLGIVPRGGADLRFGGGGAVELNGLSDGGDDGATVLATSNLVSRSAGRILLPLNPPLGLAPSMSATAPHVDGLVLEARYSGPGGASWQPALGFTRGTAVSNAAGGVFVRLGFNVWCDDTKLFRTLRTCVFDAAGCVGSFDGDASPTRGAGGSIRGATNTHLIRIGWATFPSSVILVFDRPVVFIGPDGTRLVGNVGRCLLLDESGEASSPSALDFEGLSIYSRNPGNGILGFSDLRVRNPEAPLIQGVLLPPNGGVTLRFAAEPDTFYALETTDSLTTPSWRAPATEYQFGSGGPADLSDPRARGVTRMYRLRVE